MVQALDPAAGIIKMKRYTVVLDCGAHLNVIATGCARAMEIATAAGWMPWDIRHVEERA
jgi:hypothetical protein